MALMPNQTPTYLLQIICLSIIYGYFCATTELAEKTKIFTTWSLYRNSLPTPALDVSIGPDGAQVGTIVYRTRLFNLNALVGLQPQLLKTKLHF